MTVAMDNVLRIVAKEFGVSVADIKSARRSRHVVPARLIAAYLAHTVSGMTPREIGSRLGDRDYTNIEMYCRATARRAEEDEAFKRLLLELEEAVRGRAGLT
jgi:chromosomal replication initiator protein